MNLKFLETFVWVARLKSFRLTAEKLFSTQASISSRIAVQVWMTVSMAPMRIRPWVLAPVSSDCFSACMVSIMRSA